MEINHNNPILSMEGKVRQPVVQNAIQVQNAVKSYPSKGGSVSVLNGFNMNVEKGTIYSLLGSSGCGKTTILACCIGLRKLERGNVFINGHPLGSGKTGVPGNKLGYMPQDIALEPCCTIEETLWYYGLLYNMNRKQVQSNTKFLVEFLHLPSVTQLIDTLSGGQKRRVSFAAALLHNPEILILDEPTVGVDPLLRQSIWNHLKRLVSSGSTTVIITTHYIEEARASQRVGLMRNGKLLVEDDPNKLLEDYKEKSLEKIVLRLCLQDTPFTDGEDNKALLEESNVQFSSGGTLRRFARETKEKENLQNNGGVVGLSYKQRAPEDYECNEWNNLQRPVWDDQSYCYSIVESLSRIWAFIYKLYCTLTRNWVFLFVLIFLPASQVWLVCVVIGGEFNNIKFGVVNHEAPGFSFQNCNSSTSCPLDKNYSGSLSCRFLELIPQKFAMTVYDTEEIAHEDLHQAFVRGFILFPDNFTKFMSLRIEMGVLADEDVINGSRIKLKMDLTNRALAFEMKKTFLETLQKFIVNVSEECNMDPEVMTMPLVFDEPVFGTDEITFAEYMSPGLMIVIIFFLMMSGSSISYIKDSKLGVLDRALVTGMQKMEILLSYSVFLSIVMLCQIGLTLISIVIPLKLQIHGSILLIISITVVTGLAGLIIGFAFTAIIFEELQAFMVEVAMFLPNCFIAGIVWPLQSLPYLMKCFSVILPCTLAAESVRSLMSRGVGLSHISVWPGLLSSFAWATFYTFLAVTIHRILSRKR